MTPLNVEHEQLIVLTEFLRRYRDTNHLSVEHDAETIALWDLCGQFEAMADKRPNAEEIEKAREAVAIAAWDSLSD